VLIITERFKNYARDWLGWLIEQRPAKMPSAWAY